VTPEFSRAIDVRQADGRALTLSANPAECAALARRFDLVRIDRLGATVTLTRDGEAIAANGTIDAGIVQSCAVSAEDLPVAIREAVAFRFVPAAAPGTPDEVIELDPDELDEIPFTGTTIDLGEAIAQSLALAIDPFAIGPSAEEARRRLSGEGDTGPFAALKGLKLD
jgi:uncharacterized metal-binding protein YceD (DUF177 family)